jgi:hypothetical protein
MKRSSAKHNICLICYQVQQSTLIAFHSAQCFFDIKMNPKIIEIYQKNNLLSMIKFYLSINLTNSINVTLT